MNILTLIGTALIGLFFGLTGAGGSIINLPVFGLGGRIARA
jgi:uncharacterized membrane protein YfcA